MCVQPGLPDDGRRAGHPPSPARGEAEPLLGGGQQCVEAERAGDDDLEAGRVEAGGRMSPVPQNVSWVGEMKLGLLRRVYALLSMHLVLVIATCWLLMSNKTLAKWVLSSSGLVFAVLVLIVSLGVMLVMHESRERHPHNIYLLLAWTLCVGYMSAVISLIFDEVGLGLMILEV